GIKKWLKISPRNAITVLDTHDGIGIVDIGAGSLVGEEEGLIAPEVINDLVESIHEKSQGKSRQATGAAASNLDLYQVNCTFFDALGGNEHHYLLARLIQFFCPGIPQVYYVGFLAGENDMKLLEKTGVGRDINREYFSRDSLLEHLEKEVVKSLSQLIRFRNEHPAFEGEFELKESDHKRLNLRWEKDEDFAELILDLETYTFELSFSSNNQTRVINNHFDFSLDSIRA
ncbi:MAG: sucrose phosphorylase, partial [Bacteroidota bacterium]